MEKNSKNVITIPNIMSLFRLCLIPIITHTFMGLKRYTLASILVLVSAATDILDGIIARKFNMTSDLGKVLDPFADKLTQFALILCLRSKYVILKKLIILFVIKELVQCITIFIATRKSGIVPSSKWFGKVSTVFIYCYFTLLILIPNINTTFVSIGALCSGVLLLISLVGYMIFGIKMIVKK